MDRRLIPHQEVYILGDLNLNLIFEGRRIPNGIKRYREFCALHGLKQIIDSPTRVTKTSSTILDHILTNSKDKISQFGVIDVGLSDHQLIYCTRKTVKPKYNTKTRIKYRSLKHYKTETFLEKLKLIEFPDYSTYNNINEAYADLIQKINSVIDELAPEKEMYIKNNTEEWIDEDIFEGIRIRDKKFKKFKRTRLHIDDINYRKARNHLQKIIRKKKETILELN